MNDCTVCVAYVVDLREDPKSLTAKGWKSHMQLMHTYEKSFISIAAMCEELTVRMEKVREAVG